MSVKIIFATGNKDKLKEIRMIMHDLDVDVVSMKDAGIDVDIVEDGSTFEENALIKARTVGVVSGCITLADDSGLEVDYLHKEPGVHSARYMGEDTPYSIKNKSIIDRLEKAIGDERRARFVCAIAAYLPGGECITTRGTIEGMIGYEEKGENGFGYDPIVYVPELGCTTGELSPEDKNAISHRGRALGAMKKRLLELGLVQKK